MATKATSTRKKATAPVTAAPVVGTPTSKPSLPTTLETLQFLRTAKGKTDSAIHSMLDKAKGECQKAGMELMLERIMLHIGDVSRQHNILREFGILSDKGGAQERKIFRSILRWWEKNLPESFERNIRTFVEFTLYENLMFYQITSDRNTGTIKEVETLFPMPEKVHAFLASQIRKGKDLNLIARHLPKYSTGNTRTTKKTIKARKGVESFNWSLPKGKAWVKINGKHIELSVGKIQVKTGDVVEYPRSKQSKTIEKQKFINSWIINFCEVMGWDLKAYKEFRKNQNTPEQKFSSKSVLDLPKSDFMTMLDHLTAGQRFRVAKMVCYKDGDTLCAKPKWGKLGTYYIEWEKGQEKVAEKLRQAAVTGDESVKKELMKEFKVKSTGVQTIDLLAQIANGKLNTTQIDNTYQSLIEKMDLIASVFPVIDGSGSMDGNLSHNGVNLTYRQIVYSMAIAFSTRNPIPEFRNTYGWFSRNFTICGNSKFVNTAPNPYVSSASFTKKVPTYQVLSEAKTFTENLAALRAADPKEVSSTNMGSVVEYFVKLVEEGKFHVEDLPQAILYLTDNENNTGKSISEVIKDANKIGWRPLMIFWGITNVPQNLLNEAKKTPNCLFVGGFNESTLSQILRGIKTGSVNPEDELWSIFEDKRYSILK